MIRPANTATAVAMLFLSVATAEGALSAAATAAPSLEDGHLAVRLRDFSAAMGIWKELAEKDNNEAQYQLAVAYRTGRGTETNCEQAALWMKRAARAGHTKAQFAVAQMYRRGLGMDGDRDKALYWYGQAARAGHEGATRALNELASAASITSAAGNTRLALIEDDADALLDQAIRLGDEPAAMDALAKSASPNGRDNGPAKAPPLLRAARAGNTRIASQLVRYGADPNLPGPRGVTPLAAAAQRGNVRMVRGLLASGADVDATDVLGATPLMTAARRGHLGAVRELLAGAANPNLALEDRRTALDLAQAGDHAAVAAALVRAGARQRKRSQPADRRKAAAQALAKRGERPALGVAAQRGQLELVEALIAAGAPIDTRDADGTTPLLRAAASGQVAVVKRLLAAGANPNAASAEGTTPLMAACDANDGSSAETLLAAGADGSAKDSAGRNAFEHAASAEGSEALEALLKSIAPAPLEAEAGSRCLHAAARAGRTDNVVRLLAAGAVDHESGPALCAAIRQGHAEVVRLLITDLDIGDMRCGVDEPLILRAARLPSPVIANLLLSAGSTANQRSPQGNTALMIAADLGHTEVVAALLRRGADIEARGYQRRTALMFAAEGGHWKAVRSLLRAGARPGARNEFGTSAATLARQAGETAVADRIENHRGGIAGILDFF